MEALRSILKTRLRLTPARSFLLGTAFMLVIPEALYSRLALQYHEVMQDNTYQIEDSIISASNTSPSKSTSPQPLSATPPRAQPKTPPQQTPPQ